MATLASLLDEVRTCTACSAHLPHGPRPIVQAHASARILIIGQAPGRKVHDSGIPFNDASGERLRTWLEIPREVFYDARRIALVPVDFCFPGTGRSGDLPPRAECAPRWQAPLLAHLKSLQLTLAVGQYAQAHHLPHEGASLTAAVQAWRKDWPRRLALPHPSPRNNLWLKRNPWFERELLPELRARVEEVLR